MDLDEWLNASKTKRWSISSGDLHNLIDIAADQRDQARAERDAAVGAVHELITAGRDAYDNGYPEMERAVCEARAALARLPQAAERAQAQRDVVAAARDVDKAWSPDSAVALRSALARLDALESGGGE